MACPDDSYERELYNEFMEMMDEKQEGQIDAQTLDYADDFFDQLTQRVGNSLAKDLDKERINNEEDEQILSVNEVDDDFYEMPTQESKNLKLAKDRLPKNLDKEQCPQNATIRLIDDDDDFFNQATQQMSASPTNNLLGEIFGNLSSDDERDEYVDRPSNLSASGKEILKNLKADDKFFKLGSKTATNTKNTWRKKSSSSKATLDENRVDPYSGIRIIKPLVSSDEMKTLIDGRNMVRMMAINANKVKEPEFDWVTVGIVAQKSLTKASKTGSNFAVWKLTDLKSDKFVSLFLFGNAYSSHWKLSVGTVIGLLNADVLEERKDDGKSKKKNKTYTQRTSVTLSIAHPGKLLVIGTSKDIGSCSGSKKNGDKCEEVINLSESKYCLYHTRIDYKSISSSRSELQSSFSGIQPKNSQMERILSQKQDYVKSFYSKPKTCEPSYKEQMTKAIAEEKQATLAKLREGLKTRKETENASLARTVVRPVSVSAKLLAASTIKTTGKLNGLKNILPMNVRAFLEPVKISSKQVHVSTKQANVSTKPTNNPMLGKGLEPGAMVCLPEVSRAKKVAIAVLKQKPIAKDDPNLIQSSKKRKLSDVQQRVDSNLTASKEPTTNSLSSSNQKQESNESKRLKLQLINQALKLKSNHEHEASAAEVEAEVKYFNVMERKEKVEAKMLNRTELECTLYNCKVCKYVAQGLADVCKAKGHPYVTSTGIKRFFACKSCKQKTHTYNAIIPTKGCPRCGNSTFDKASMFSVRDGPKQQRDKLLIRGEERKFLN